MKSHKKSCKNHRQKDEDTLSRVKAETLREEGSLFFSSEIRTNRLKLRFMQVFSKARSRQSLNSCFASDHPIHVQTEECRYRRKRRARKTAATDNARRTIQQAVMIYTLGGHRNLSAYDFVRTLDISDFLRIVTNMGTLFKADKLPPKHEPPSLQAMPCRVRCRHLK